MQECYCNPSAHPRRHRARWWRNGSAGRGRHRWIAYLGLLIVLYVAVEMIWRRTAETWPVINGAI